jgi:hypothetical protein
LEHNKFIFFTFFLHFSIFFAKNTDKERKATLELRTCAVLFDLDSKFGYLPILRPLSDLHKYNQIGDNSFRDELLLKSELQNDFERDFITDYIDKLHFDKILYAPYSIIEKLLEHHFDIFGLIESGLAIDINTLKPE